MKYTHNDERGSVLVFMTLMIVLLLILVGMGLDTGQLTYSRSQGQAAVDAAALAAVSGMPSGDAEVRARVVAFNASNTHIDNTTNAITAATDLSYISYDGTTITPQGSIATANGVRVALEQKNPYSGTTANRGLTSPLFLTPLLNLFGASAPGIANVSVSAVAALAAAPGIPITIQENICLGADRTNPGKNPDVLVRQSSTPADNSCWTTYSCNPPSAARVKDWFNYSYTCSNVPCATDLTKPIEVNNGQENSVYQAAYDLFIDKFPNQYWRVPIVRTGTGCVSQEPILGWAKIYPTVIDKSGNPKFIKADVYCGQPYFGITDSMCFTPRLIREPAAGM